MADSPQSKSRRGIPGKPKKKLVIPSKTGSKKPGMKKTGIVPGKPATKKPGMKKTGVVPGKVAPPKSQKQAKAVPVVLTDDNIVSKTGGDSRFSKTMIENVQDSHPQTIIQMEPRSISEMIAEDAELEFLSDQVSAYRELSEMVDEGGWTPERIIDLMDVFARAINLETVIIGLVNPARPTSFSKLAARGNHSYPSKDTINYLQESIEAGSVNWDKLMKLAIRKISPFQDWARAEIFEFMAFVPIHDGHQVLGFILSATRDQHHPSDIASTLLELVGGRLGLSISAHSTHR